ncbi:ferredoxin [Enterococcus nangangensis]|uniref:ferredoxin n=1 Tax=Enterococcus nangangensis TaxID=2559926 RepID=UPI0010FA2793|nr:ferredoxin [Enterococcus nangangensis]
MECQLVRPNCIACGLCQTLAPKTFDYDDEGIVCFLNTAQQITHQSILPQEEENVIAAIKRCPTQALLAK